MSDLTTLRADFASLCAALPAASNSTASPLSNAAREESLGAAISSAVALFTTSDEGDLTAATEELSTAAETPALWLLPTRVVDEQLASPEKRQFMTERVGMMLPFSVAVSSTSSVFLCCPFPS